MNHKALVIKLIEEGFTRDQAISALGVMVEYADTAYQQGFAKGYNEGHEAGELNVRLSNVKVRNDGLYEL